MYILQALGDYLVRNVPVCEMIEKLKQGQDIVRINKRSCCHWDNENPYILLENHTKYLQKIHVRAGNLRDKTD